jgi:hypothetical protein
MEIVTMKTVGYLILVAAIRIKIGGPVVCFRAWQPRLTKKGEGK